MDQIFLCSKHREHVRQHPASARQMFCDLMERGRAQVRLGAWKEAVAFFGTAFETAEILLYSDPCPWHAVDRYIRVAVEFTYALRKSPYHADIEALVALVKGRLENTMLPKLKEDLADMLDEIAYSPLGEAEFKMQTLYHAGMPVPDTEIFH